MVQKAKLDILENLPELEIIEASSDIQEESFPPLRGKWATNKLLLIGAPVLIGVFVLAGLLWFYVTQTPTIISSPQIVNPDIIDDIKKGDVSAATAGEQDKQNTAYLKDFIIDLKDKNGKNRILLCDIAVDLNEEKDIVGLENNGDMRSIIYTTAKLRGAVALKSIEERRRLKKELLQEFNKMLGEGIVKNVYFTNYIIM
jgi:flagellar basal body-associated protein FliL